MSIQAADGAPIQSRHPGSCSTRQCRVKKGYGKYAFRPRMELLYKPETRSPAVTGSAGLKRIREVRVQDADVALIQPRDPGSCSTRQCRVKKDMGNMHSGPRIELSYNPETRGCMHRRFIIKKT